MIASPGCGVSAGMPDHIGKLRNPVSLRNQASCLCLLVADQGRPVYADNIKHMGKMAIATG